MVAFALLVIGTVLAAVCAGLRILKQEYRHLLWELDKRQPWDFHEEDLFTEEEETE